MKPSRFSLTLLSGLMLAACGGGSGGDAPSSGSAAATSNAVVISETNAKVVSGSAMESVQNTSATQGSTGLATGVEVDANAAGLPANLLLALALQGALTGLDAQPALATGVTVSNKTLACKAGGSMVVNGSIAGSSGFAAGDHMSLDASNCKVSASGLTLTLNGHTEINVVSGAITASPPFKAVIDVTMASFGVSDGTRTYLINGAERLDWNATSAEAQTIVVTSASLSTKTTVGTTSRSTTLSNFTQTLTITGPSVSLQTLTIVGPVFTSAVSASVETDSTKLGVAGGSYTVSTPKPLTWNGRTGDVTAGVIKVVGANNSQLLATVGANNTVTVQIDANGDGVYEKTVTTTIAELRTQL